MGPFRIDYLCLIIISAGIMLVSGEGEESPNVKAYLLEKADTFSGTKVFRYKQNPYAWGNITYLLATREVEKVEQVCVEGAWLIYPEPEYLAPSLDKIYYMGAASSRKCALLDEVGGVIGSMQPLTAYTRKTDYHITFFRDTNFLGTAMPVNGVEKPPRQEPTSSTFVQSLVIINEKQWTLVMDDGTVYCLQVDLKSGPPICFLSNLVDNNKVKLGGVQKVRRGCKRLGLNISTVIDLKECSSMDGLTTINVAWPFEPPKDHSGSEPGEGGSEPGEGGSEPGEGGSEPGEGGSEPGEPGSEPGSEPAAACDETSQDVLDDELKSLIESRLDGSLNNGNMLKAIKNPKNIWKMELFDSCYQTLLMICPGSVVDVEYLQIFSALYQYHLDKVWEDGKFASTSISEEAWMEINQDMRVCMERVPTSDINAVALLTVAESTTYTKLSDIKDKVDKLLGFRPQFDHVMEINWLMANVVASVCYSVLNFDVNFLPRFLNIYHELYFLPIMEQWSNPGKFSTAYKYIFGGYGMDKTLTKITLAVYNAMKAAEVIDPYKRPMEQDQKIFLPKVIESS